MRYIPNRLFPPAIKTSGRQMVSWMHTGHRRFPVRGPRCPTYIVVLCVDWPGMVRLQDLVAEEVGLFPGQRFFPHITLCGPLKLCRGADIVELLDRAVRHLSPARVIHPADLHLFSGKRGLAVSLLIREDPELTALARSVSSTLAPFFINCNPIDLVFPRRILHVSVAVNLPKQKGKRIFSLLENPGGKLSRETENLVRSVPPRITYMAVIRRGAVWKAYDFPKRKWVDRSCIFREKNPSGG